MGRYLIAFAFSANDIFCGYFEVVKVEGTCRGRSDAEFLLLFHNFDAHVFGSDKTGDAFVSFTWVNL